MNGYVKGFDDNKCMSLLVHDDEVLKKYNKIWDKISNLLKRVNSETVYNDKYIKTKIKIYNYRINTNYQGNKIPNIMNAAFVYL